jgi:acyl dehydratase
MTLYFEDMPAGTAYELGSRQIDEASILRFGREHDPQPFHVDVELAKASSFGGLVASGLQTFAVFSRLATDALMGRTANLGGLGVDGMRWFVPVRPGDILRGHATVTEETRPSNSQPDRGILVLRGELFNQRGERVWTATITSLVMRRT